ncbi:MAG: tRNA (adenosine(37)-N6)-dimethylallyltransferase MiaA [Jiangellaceae bacterium]
MPRPSGRRNAARRRALRFRGTRGCQTGSVRAGSDLPVYAIVGPTAAGKSDLAVGLALRVGGEVVNGDSMQLYRGMDIGTAKLPVDQRQGVPHHLLDVLDVTQTATVAEFQLLARAAIDDCRARGVVPILAGGSALYVRAVLDRFDFPGTDPDLRAGLEAELEEAGTAALHGRLAAVDPDAAAVILPSNARRVVRALEVITLTGRPYAAALPPKQYAYDHVVQIGLSVPKPDLDARIEVRVDRMWADGLVGEVRRLEAHGLREGRTASRALGYAQVLRYLAGECSEREAQDDTVVGTRRFARRQAAWFDRDDRIAWIRYDADDLTGAVLAYDLRS